MAFPSKKETRGLSQKIERSEGSLVISAHASPLEILRWELCQNFIKYLRREKISQKELSKRLGVDEAKVSKILHHRIHEFSTDRLIELYTIIAPDLKFKVS